MKPKRTEVSCTQHAPTFSSQSLTGSLCLLPQSSPEHLCNIFIATWLLPGNSPISRDQKSLTKQVKKEITRLYPHKWIYQVTGSSTGAFWTWAGSWHSAGAHQFVPSQAQPGWNLWGAQAVSHFPEAEQRRPCCAVVGELWDISAWAMCYSLHLLEYIGTGITAEAHQRIPKGSRFSGKLRNCKPVECPLMVRAEPDPLGKSQHLSP